MKSETKIALITGGSRGLGRSTAENLAKRGVDSVITYNVNKEEAETVVKNIRSLGARAVALQLDTGNAESFVSFESDFKQALATLDASNFDYLINNAGNSSGMGFLSATQDEFDILYRIHVKGVFFLTQTLVPLLRDGGRVINVSSGLTRVIMPNRAAYATMKSAVETMTKYMALELGHRNIAVNCVAPGAIATDFSGGAVRDNPDVAKAIAGMTALGRTGQPDDIGAMIASLVSDENRWVNAQRIEVSGGMRI